MKKVFFTGVFALALVAIIGYGINKNRNLEQFSDLALQNIEALAQEEGGGDKPIEFQTMVFCVSPDNPFGYLGLDCTIVYTAQRCKYHCSDKIGE